MRALKTIPIVVALSLAPLPALARPAPAKTPAAAPARPSKAPAKSKPADKKANAREARVLEALQREGIDSARAKQVVAVMKKYRLERIKVNAGMQTHKASLRVLLESDSTDQDAYSKALDGLKDGRKQLQDITDRQMAEIQQILKPSEQAKVLKLLQRAKQNKQRKGRQA